MIYWPDLHTWDALPVFAELFWKSGALLGAAIGASAFLRNRSADLRRLVLSAAVVIMILAVALTPVMPRRAATLPFWLMLPASPSPTPSAASFGPKFDNWEESLPQHGQPRALATPFKHSRFGLRDWLMHRLPVIPLVWFVGAAILLARFLVGLYRLRRLRIDSHALNDDGLLGRLGHSGITLLENESIGSPVTWGILRPIVLVPTRFHKLPIDDRLRVLCHELAHIHAYDFVLRVLVEVVCALIWFQPLVWVARRQLREEQELACDNRVLAAAGKPSAYARLLLEWEDRGASGRKSLIAVGMAQQSSLKRRLYALLDVDAARERASLAAHGIVCFLGLVAAVPMAAFHIVPGSAPVLHLAGALNSRPLQPPTPRTYRPQEIAMARAAADDRPQVQPQASPAAAQSVATNRTPETKYAFEVASIKPAPPDDGRNMAHVSGGPGTSDPGQFTALNITLRWLLVSAFPESYRVIGPDWLDAAHYDLVAKVPPGTSKDQFKLMFQNLLEERAALKAHHEIREFPAYNLVVAKEGAKLAEASEQAAPPAGQSSEQKLDAEGYPQLDRPGLVTYNFSSHGAPITRLVGRDQPLSSLARMLRIPTHAYVIDKTGLQGKYDFRLEYAFDNTPTTAPSQDDSTSAPFPAPSIFTAIKSLGLMLQQARASLDVLVIDHIERVLQPN